MKKAFLVTGLSNVLGRHEDNLICDDTVRKESFGESDIGFQKKSPFSSDSEDDEEPPDSSACTSSGLDSDSSTVCTPNYESIYLHDLSDSTYQVIHNHFRRQCDNQDLTSCLGHS